MILPKIFHFTTNLSGGGAETQMLILTQHLDDFKHIIIYQTHAEGFDFSKYKNCDFMTIDDFKKKSMSYENCLMHIWIPDVFTYLRPWFFMRSKGRVLVGIRNRYTLNSLKRVYQFFSYFWFKQLVSNTPVSIHPLLYRLLYNSRKFRFIPNAVKYDVWSSPPPYDLQLKLLYVGRLVKQKGIDYMLSAIETLPNELAERIKLKVVGRGPEETRVLKSCETLADSVFYEGYTTTPLEYYREANFLILPSFYEGMPNVAFEALSQGNIPLLSDIPQHRRWFTEENAFFFEAGNKESLQQAIFRAATIKAAEYEKMRNSGLKILDQLSISDYARKYRELYNEILT